MMDEVLLSEEVREEISVRRSFDSVNLLRV